MGNFSYRQVSKQVQLMQSNQYVHIKLRGYHYIYPKDEQNNYENIIKFIKENYEISTNSRKFYNYMKNNPLEFPVYIRLTLSSLWTSDDIKIVKGEKFNI